MSSRATRLTSVTSALLALLASLILVAWIAPAVQAHSQLVSSDPEDGAELSRAPEEITLTFNEPLLPDFVRMIVTNPDGEIGDLIITTVDGPTAIATWPQNLVPGDWTVTYRVVSQDGHPIEGSIDFSYVESSPSPTSESPTPTPTPTSTTATPPDPTIAPEPTATSSPAEESPTASPSDSIPSPEASPASDSSSSSNAGWIIAGVAVVVLAAIAIVGLVARSRTR